MWEQRPYTVRLGEDEEDSVLLFNLDHEEFEKLHLRLRELYTLAYRPLPQYACRRLDEVDSYLSWLYSGDPAGFFVAGYDREASRVAGFAAAHGKWRQPDGSLITELHELVVDPRWQGHGIGTVLVRRVVEYARQLGRKAVGLWVGEQNQRAMAIYRRLGFCRTGKWHCWVRMELTISPSPRPALRRARAKQQSEPLKGDPGDLLISSKPLESAGGAGRGIAFGERDRPMLDALFAPASVAVAGAAREEGKLGHTVLHNIIRYGYKGRIYPVNPRADEVLGLRAYPKVSDVPEPVDLVVVAVPPRVVADVLRDSAARGAKAAIVISAGFRECGPEGAVLEREVVRIAKEARMRLLGPNCLGVIDAYSRLNATFAAGGMAPGDIAFMSQSGALGTAILDWAERESIGFSKFVSLGNKGDITEVDLLDAWACDPRTKVIIAYLESIADGRRFIEVAARLTRVKPVIMVKSGGTAAGARAASSHTGALAGSDTAYDAALKQTGVIRVRSLEELFDLSVAFASQPLPRDDRVAIVTNAGGPGVMATDACERHGLRLAALSPDTIADLRRHLPQAAAFYNPVDVVGDAGPERYQVALDCVLADEGVDAAVVLLTPQAMTDPAGVADVVVKLAAQHGKPVVTSFMGGTMIQPAVEALRKGAVPNYPFPERAVGALGGLNRQRLWRTIPVEQAPVMPRDKATAAHAIALARAERRINLTDVAALRVFAAYGLRVPRSEVVLSADAAVAAAEAIGYPVAMKVTSPDILHKTDVGGVRLDLRSPDEVRSAYTTVRQNVRRFAPQAIVQGVTVQEMAKPGKEVIIGVTRDPQFGHLLMFGVGGIYVEVLKDVSFRVVPLTRRDATEMLREIRSYPLLLGVRGEQRVDLDAVVEAILRVAQLVDDFPEIAEMDINPLIVYGEGAGALAVDGRIILIPTEQQG